MQSKLENLPIKQDSENTLHWRSSITLETPQPETSKGNRDLHKKFPEIPAEELLINGISSITRLHLCIKKGWRFDPRSHLSHQEQSCVFFQNIGHNTQSKLHVK
jgi:hypothetical protein